jgi:hypothetical protein
MTLICLRSSTLERSARASRGENGGGLFERRSFGPVYDDLKLALVIERRHLHCVPPDCRGG